MMDTEISNYLLLDYIQRAFDFINRRSPIAGIPQNVKDKLHPRWMQQVVGVPTPEDLQESGGRARAGSRPDQTSLILSGHADDFHVDADVQSDLERDQAQHVIGFHRDHAQLQELGVEAYATYWPIHFFSEHIQLSNRWGIYISEEGIVRLAAVLRERCHREFGEPAEQIVSDNGKRSVTFSDLAYQVLLRHELQHFKIEVFALHAELVLGKPLYVPYLTNVYAETYPEVDCLEEALANATVLNSTAIATRFKKLYPMSKPGDFNKIIIDEFIHHQPPCYKNYYLGADRSSRSSRRNGTSAHQQAMNHVCNQIISGDEQSNSEPVPFFAFPPDNYFLRAEKLVPIHIVGALDPADAFILVPVKWREWERFIKAVGYSFGRQEGSHQTWVCQGLENLTLNRHGDEVGGRAVTSTLLNWQITKIQFRRYFQQWRDTNNVPSELSQHLNSLRAAGYRARLNAPGANRGRP